MIYIQCQCSRDLWSLGCGGWGDEWHATCLILTLEGGVCIPSMASQCWFSFTSNNDDPKNFFRNIIQGSAESSSTIIFVKWDGMLAGSWNQGGNTPMCKVRRGTGGATNPWSSHSEQDPTPPVSHPDPPSSSPAGAVSPGTAGEPGGGACLC